MSGADRINVALVGLGKMGVSHLAIANATQGMKLAAVCDSFTMLGQMVEKHLGIPYVADYAELIARPDLQGVIIATPTRFHDTMIRDALARGVHEAEIELGITPKEVVDRYHPEILGYWEDLGISFDLFTTTMTDNHAAVTQDVFLRLLEKGYMAKGTTTQYYDPEAERFLPDRYVEGTCPHCGYADARGDQCDNCGRTLDPADLIVRDGPGVNTVRIMDKPTCPSITCLRRPCRSRS